MLHSKKPGLATPPFAWRTHLRAAALVSLAAFTAAPPLAMAATTSLGAFASTSDGVTYIPLDRWENKNIVTNPNAGPATISVSETGTANISGLTVEMTGNASAGPGWLRSSSSAYGASIGEADKQRGYFEVGSFARWVEQDMVISASSSSNLNGTLGSAYASVAIDGRILSDGGEWQVALGFEQAGPVNVIFENPAGWGGSNYISRHHLGLDSLENEAGSYSIVLPIKVNFRFGSEFDFGLGLITVAGAFADGLNGISYSSVDFGHTLTWGGINKITDANGNVLNGVTIASGSNFDFFAPATVPSAVPEPETYAMLLAGLGLIGTIARRRRAAQRR